MPVVTCSLQLGKAWLLHSPGSALMPYCAWRLVSERRISACVGIAPFHRLSSILDFQVQAMLLLQDVAE